MKPCPFCLDNDCHVAREAFFGHVRMRVVCENCAAQGPSASTDMLAIEKWNERPGAAERSEG